ncbi:MAG TPA: restriction endonuclease subunit S [Elusimicrobiota bacterium]|nr:restriction endonuclease subunit S [Elusimicrobiota bacterium]
MSTDIKWQPRRLDELGVVGRGKSRHRPRNDARLYGGAHPFIQTADIMAADPYITAYSQTYSDFGLQQSKLWPPNTLCMTIAGANTAKTAILKFEACFPDSVVGFIPNEKEADLHFVKYSLDAMKVHFLAVSRGATQDNLSLDKLLSFPIHTPPLPIQKRIAGIISAYDDLIENNLRRIRILEAMARVLYREAMADSKSTISMKALSSPYWEFISENVTPYSGKRRYYATADVDGHSIVGDGIEYFFSDKPSRAQKQPEKYSIWFARMKDTHKIAWFTEANQDVAQNSILSSGFAGFRARHPSYFPVLFLTISSPEFHTQKDLFCSGATQMSLTNEGLSRIEVQLPSEQMARRVGEQTLPMLNQMLVFHQQNLNLRNTRNLLVPRLISGQVPLAEPALSA